MINGASVGRQKLFRQQQRKTAVAAALFLLPGMIVYLCFIGGPVLLSLILSFTKYDILHPAKWTGLANFKEFFSNPRVSVIMLNTLKYALILIPIHVGIGLCLALIVDAQKGKFMTVATRSAVYFPFLITTASAAAAWIYMFDNNYGVFNYILLQLGLNPVFWLTKGNWPYLALAIYSAWKYIGDPFLFYLVGLQTIPDDYNEAAKIDGANAVQTFFHVKLPLLTPTIFYVLIIKTIHCFQVFEEPFLLTDGGPGDTTRSIALYLYQNAFVYFDMGYASTIALFLFIITVVVTLILFGTQKKWVCYDT